MSGSAFPVTLTWSPAAGKSSGGITTTGDLQIPAPERVRQPAAHNRAPQNPGADCGAIWPLASPSAAGTAAQPHQARPTFFFLSPDVLQASRNR